MHRERKDKNKNTFEPDYAVPPGATLAETIESLGMDQQELAERTGLTPKTLNLIIKGKAPLTQQTAMLLERVTKVPARIWNNLEANYQERLAKLQAREQLAEQTEWLKSIPTKVLIERGYIQPTNDKVALLEQTLAFFRVASVAIWKEGWNKSQFAFRKHQQASPIDGKLATWLQIAEHEAERCNTRSYNKNQFKKAIAEVRSLTRKSPSVFVPQLCALYRECGVVVSLIEEIPGAKISGAAKWLSPNKAMIAVNLRGKKSDLFWFTLFHESGHILNDSKKTTYVDVSYSDDPTEMDANEFATQILIPSKYNSHLTSLRTAAAIKHFAEELNLDPGIVVGRLQHDKIIGYRDFNELKKTLRFSGSQIEAEENCD